MAASTSVSWLCFIPQLPKMLPLGDTRQGTEGSLFCFLQLLLMIHNHLHTNFNYTKLMGVRGKFQLT